MSNRKSQGLTPLDPVHHLAQLFVGAVAVAFVGIFIYLNPPANTAAILAGWADTLELAHVLRLK